MPGLSGLRDLIAFLTAIPVGGGSVDGAARSFHLVPLVGILEGTLLGASVAILSFMGADALLAGAIYMLLHVAVTGGLHLDGLADYSDVIGSRRAGGEALSILKDPRRGSFAVVSVTAVLLASMASAAVIADTGAAGSPQSFIAILASLTLPYLLASEALYLVITLGETEPYEGLAYKFKRAQSTRSHIANAIVFSACTVALWVVLYRVAGPLHSLAVPLSLAALAAVSAYVLGDAERRLGFVNGDVAGFAYEVTRTAVLVLTALWVG